jgi:plasmid maintenance system killer protein
MQAFRGGDLIRMWMGCRSTWRNFAFFGAVYKRLYCLNQSWRKSKMKQITLTLYSSNQGRHDNSLKMHVNGDWWPRNKETNIEYLIDSTSYKIDQCEVEPDISDNGNNPNTFQYVLEQDCWSLVNLVDFYKNLSVLPLQYNTCNSISW